MKKTTTNDQKDREIAAIEAALAETHADIEAGRVVRESAEAHVKRLKKQTLSNDSMLTQRDFEAFTSAVEDPPKPTLALRKLIARK